jgi:preprotein translocase subunit SecA
VEARNFDQRKQILEYDDVANDQRKVIYQQRNELLETADISETITAMREGVLDDTVSEYITPGSMEEQWDVPSLEKTLAAEYQLHLPLVAALEHDKTLDENGLRARIVAMAQQQYQAKVDLVGEMMHGYERILMLQSVDTHWREHLAALDHLRQGIHLRGYAQKNPKQEYKREAFELFSTMLETIKRDVTQTLMNVQIGSGADVEAVEAPHAPANVQYHHADYDEALGKPQTVEEVVQQAVRGEAKIGRNDPCPCGSGRKYKQCHGKLA